MSPRLKVRAAAAPLVIAGALWGGSELWAAGHGSRAQTPPPCGPDGVCLPRPHTFGVYQTRWRTFPGDVIGKAPTEAEAAPDEDEAREDLSGPKLPEAGQEGQIGPAQPARDEEGAAPPAEEGADLPSDIPLPGLGAPPVELPPMQPPTVPPGDQPGAAPPAEAPAEPPAGEAAPAEPPADQPQPEPGAEPERDPFDPFGEAPPEPPSWMRSAASTRAVDEPAATPAPTLPSASNAAPSLPPQASTIEQPPSVIPAAAQSAPEAIAAPLNITAPIVDGPNSQSEDAPPGLPAGLKAAAVGSASRQPWTADAAPVLPPMTQPATIHPSTALRAGPPAVLSTGPPAVLSTGPTADGRVTPASAEEPVLSTAEGPVGIQLINPAAAVAVEPGEDGLQQAIYYEASDRD